MVKTSTLAVILAALIISIAFADEADAAGLVKRAISTVGTWAVSDIPQLPATKISLTDGNIIVGDGSGIGSSVNPTGDVDISNTGVFSISNIHSIGNVTSVGCAAGQVLKVSGTTWECAADSTGSGIASINADTTAAQTIIGVTGNTTASTASGATTINLGTDVVTTGGSAQTITKAFTINSLTLGGSLDVGSKAVNNYNVTTVTTTGTLNSNGEVILLNPSTTAFTVTLPDATGNTGKHYRFFYIATTGTAVTIDGDAADTINGRTSISMKYPRTAVDVYSDGTNWYAIYADQIYARENYAVYTDDCLSSIGTSTTVGIQCTLGWTDTGTGTETGLMIDSVVDHPGIKQLGTTAVSGDDNFFFLASTAVLNTFDSDDTFDLTFVVRPVTAITTVNYAVGANLNTVTATYLTSENAMFMFDSAGTNTGGDTTHWVCRTRSSGGTDQTTATAITVTLNQWYNLRVLKDSGTIRFLIDDVNVCNHSTQIPSGPLNPFIAIDTLAAAARAMDFDYFRGSWVPSGR
ncbi:MAG: hypothetical protein HOO66_05705 [Nitrosarchaeum sp.]|nr:hypothetical protein [Nitrosarchaeum sp.]